MLDRALESELYPRRMLKLDALGFCLCVAPHPDDEVLGCGGLLALLALNAQPCASLILTRGEKATDQSQQQSREEESEKAAAILGTPPPAILNEGDRQLRYSESLIASIRHEIESRAVRTLLLPSLSEPHPDHQVTALAGLAAAAQAQACKRILFYEVGAPMHPNCWIDIEAVSERKWLAIKQYDSQLKLEAYATMAKALAEVRAFGNRRFIEGAGMVMVKYAEAFFELSLDEYRQKGPLSALPQWPWMRMQQGLVNSPEDLPTVVILIRSMNRPCIHECLASVFSQTYRPIDIIIANASGTIHNKLNQWGGEFFAHADCVSWSESASKVAILEPTGDRKLSRANAANLLLEVAKKQGRYDYAIFLDDDDLFDPNHIERMVAALDQSHGAVAAYSGVRVLDEQGQTKAVYDLPWAQERLMGINFLPIHAVLFKLHYVRLSELAFDEELPVLEDWDFWIKMSRLGPFVQCPGVSASYRQAFGQSQIANQEHPNFWKNWHRTLVGSVVERSSADEMANYLSWHALELEAQRVLVLDHQKERERAEETIDSLKKERICYETKNYDLGQRISNLLDQHLEQSRSYERELQRVNQRLSQEAAEVVRLQVELQEVSELAQTNYRTACEFEQALAASRTTIEELSRDAAEVVRLQVELQEVSELAQTNYRTACEFEQALAASRTTIEELSQDAAEVVRLQEALQRVSELAQTNFRTASGLQKEHAESMATIEALNQRELESMAAIRIACQERDEALEKMALILNSRGWRLLKLLRRWLKPITGPI